ncbi:hypothetical protein Ancab_025183 [Ancistrocladus abbreviatus]
MRNKMVDDIFWMATLSNEEDGSSCVLPSVVTLVMEEEWGRGKRKKGRRWQRWHKGNNNSSECDSGGNSLCGDLGVEKVVNVMVVAWEFEAEEKDGKCYPNNLFQNQMGRNCN